MATFYGSDTFCLDDLPLIDTQITDPRVLIGQRIARRLSTPHGALGLIGDDPDAGWDVKQYVLAKMGPSAISVAKSQIVSECIKDEQVLDCDCQMSLTGNSLGITLALTTAAGPFALTLNVNELTTQAVFSFGQS